MQTENWSAEEIEALGYEPDEIDEVLAGIQALLAKATVPVVRVCLEEAREDIIHLTGRGESTYRAEDEIDAA